MLYEKGCEKMTYIENVHGSQELAIPLIIQVDTVYIKDNIHEETITDITGETHAEWAWNEWQYSHIEWAVMQAELNKQDTILAEQNITDLELQNIELGQAMTDLELLVLSKGV